jgi:transcriptional regulator with XRE-family HTH domain
MSDLKWTRRRSDAAVLLSKGYTQAEVASSLGITDRTIRRWLDNIEFSAEVDRLSVMVDLANRAERVRLAQRIVRRMGEQTNRDLLDWLKFVQSETDGAKIDGDFLGKLAAFLQDGAPAPAEGAAGSGDAADDDGAGGPEAGNPADAA